ncbi:short-chain dehydrogenase reductase [Phlyctema vagabunda]|uniref:Short-chain dehydrogenase reductase n=1 Tax=Phlyctema vagabunda TaxID=108571 RepID=A0ABR4PHC1_9HELO
MTLFPGVALVTGAASGERAPQGQPVVITSQFLQYSVGIGRATAISFAKEGCLKICICDRDVAGLKATKSLITSTIPDGKEKIQVLLKQVDMLEEFQVVDFLESVSFNFGRVDYCVNAAGVLGNNKRSTETTAQQFDLINGINYRGAWLMSRAELKQMLSQDPLPSHDGRPGARGAIVNIASQLGVVSRPNAPAYCASKAAVISMTKCDAIDYSKDSIRVNCVCPGVIATPMTQADPSFLEALQPAIDIAPMKRMGTAQEIADTCLFLCSSKSSFVQGHAMVVDGGYVIN